MSQLEGANIQSLLTVTPPTLELFNSVLAEVKGNFLDLQTYNHDPLKVATYGSHLSNVLETRGQDLVNEVYEILWRESQGIRLLFSALTIEDEESLKQALRTTEAGFYASIKTPNMAVPMNEFSNVLGGVLGLLTEDHSSTPVINGHKREVDQRIEAYKAGTGQEIKPAQMSQRTVTRRYAD